MLEIIRRRPVSVSEFYIPCPKITRVSRAVPAARIFVFLFTGANAAPPAVLSRMTGSYRFPRTMPP